MRFSITFFMLLCFFYSVSWGREWKINIKDSHLELEIDNYFSQPLRSGDSILLKGHFCLRKETPPKKCNLLSPEDLSNYDVKFFYPDITKDVSSSVEIGLKEDRHEFSFQTPDVTENVRPLLIVQIANKGSKSSYYQSALTKVQELIEKLLSRKSHCPEKSKKYVDNLISTLRKIESRWLTRLQGESAIIANRSFPIQVENFISRSSSWINAIEGWQVGVDVARGNSFEGEKSWVDIALTPYPLNDDLWKIEYLLDEKLIKKIELTNKAEVIIKDRFLTGNLISGEHLFKIKFSKRKNNSWNESWDLVFEKKYNFLTFPDSQPPLWQNAESEIASNKEHLNFSGTIQDDIGYVDLASLKSQIHFADGRIEKLPATTVLDGNVLVPSQHGNQEGASTLKFSTASVSNIPEGLHKLEISLNDFASNKSLPRFQNIIIDRTPPFIQAGSLPDLTNQRLQNLGISVVDLNAVKSQVWVNGLNVFTSSSNSFDYPFELVEGVNLIQVVSIDVAGNSTTLSLGPVLLDTILPNIANINLVNGQIVYVRSFNISGESSEPLSRGTINGTSLSISDNKLAFNGTIQHVVEGNQQASIKLVDLAGNENLYTFNYQLILKILDKNLISVLPSEESAGLKIVGLPGAARPGIQIEASDGFFNAGETISNEDGSFEIELDYFKTAIIEAFDSELDREESFDISFNVDTTFAGIVKDVYDNPLSGVTVTIASTGQTAKTDLKGVFAISSPALGDQHVIIDGSTIPESVTNGEKVFSSLSLNVNLGNRQQNVLERPIYLAPKFIDGTETQITSGSSATVESPYVPGLKIEIPAGVVNFPDGGKSGSINVLEIPSSKTSIEVLEEAEPDTVFALEPSGLTFSERVHLTLPNPNEFPVGTELAILSKNSKTGLWEVDGSANVTSENSIETKPGEGISHFSEIYAAPLGMEIKSLGSNDKPKINAFSGAITSSIQLPSFKSMGNDITPTLVYNSLWAHPTAVITNVFDLPRKYVKMSQSVGASNIFSSVKASATIERWITPEYIDSQFAVNDFVSDKIRFQGMPDKSVVSYQTDLSELPNGIYPAESSYEVRFKQLTIRTLKIKKKALFKGTKTKTKTWREETLLDAIFPPSLMTSIYHQNKKESEIGTGWKVGLGKKILNPHQDRIMIEKESGDTAVYSLKNSIDTVALDESSITAFNIINSGILKYTNSQKIFDIDLNSKSVISSVNLNKHYVNLGLNFSWCKNCLGFTLSEVNCRTGKHLKEFGKEIKSILPSSLGTFILDKKGRLSNVIGDAEPILLGRNKAYSPYTLFASMVPIIEYDDLDHTTFVPNAYKYCLSQLGEACSPLTDMQTYSTRSNRPGKWDIPENASVYDSRVYSALCDMQAAPAKTCTSGLCNYRFLNSSGNLPETGFADGSGTSAMMNNPLAMIPGGGNFILIADTGNNAIRSLDLNNNFVTTIAGNRSTYDNGDGGKAINASIYHPRGIARKSDGTIYVSTERGYIRKIGTDGIIQTIAGKPIGQGGILSDVTDMRDIALDTPSGLVLDEKNNYLYVADTGHHRIVRLNLDSYEARTVVGNSTCVPGDTLDGKTALDVSVCRPEQIALDSEKNLFVLDEANKRIRKVKFQSSDNGYLRYQASADDNSELIRNSDGTFVLSQRDGRQTLFSAAGLEIKTSDRIGRVSSYEYDAQNRLTKATLPTGQSIILSYSGNYLDTISDPSGRTTSFDYSDGRLMRVTYPDSSTKEFIYSDKGVLLEEFNQKGAKITYKMDQWNRLQEIVLPNDSRVKLTNSISQTIANDNTETNPYQLISNGDGTDSLKDIVESAANIKTTYIKDENGYVQEIISHDGKVTRITRDSKGRPTKVLNNDSSYTTLTYDQTFGDLISKYDSSFDATETYTYNQFGQITSYKSLDGKVTSAVYDPNGLVTKEVYKDEQSVSKTYNALGLPLTLTNDLGKVTQLEYDAFGNLAGIISPSGEKKKYVRNSSGNIVKSISPKNEVTEYSIDSMNRLISVKTPRNNITTYNYSSVGELLTIIDPNQNVSSFNYDEMGNVIRKTSPVGEVYEYEYDKNGNIIQEKDPSGNIKSYEYNSKNQIVRLAFPDDVVKYTYDENDNLISVGNSNSIAEMSYVKVRNRYMLSSLTSAAYDVPSFTTTNIYDGSGNRIRLETDIGNFNYNYDGNNRLRGLINFKSESIGFDYDQLSRLKKVFRPNLDTTYEWTDNNLLKKMTYSKDSSIIQNFIYQLDENGNRTEVTNLQGNSVYQYDTEGQLIAADQPEIIETFNYDNVNNRSQDQNGSYSYDARKIRLEEDYRYVYAYDARGNLVSKQDKEFSGKVWTYVYNSSSQLINVKLYETSSLLRDVSMSYDVFGRRVKKQVIDYQNSSNSKIEKYVYDGENIIGIFDEDDQLLARFTHSNLFDDDVLSVDISGYGVIKGLAQSGGTFNYIKDGQGTITEVANSAGVIVQKYAYSSFGKLLKITDAVGNQLTDPVLDTSYSYTGREFDKEIEMYYYRARYYDPHSGRFIQKDPYPGALSSPASFNPYIYSLNNSTNRVDPSGRLSLNGMLQTAAYGFLFGGLGMLYDINTSGNYTATEMALINTAVVMAAAAATGGAAAANAGITAGSASAAYAGASVGALAGGFVGGVGFEALGLGNFQQGFISGAISGGLSGYRAIASRTAASHQIARNGTFWAGCAIAAAALWALTMTDFGENFTKEVIKKKIKNPFDEGEGYYTPINGNQYNSIPGTTSPATSPATEEQYACYA